MNVLKKMLIKINTQHLKKNYMMTWIKIMMNNNNNKKLSLKIKKKTMKRK